jgi:hypothetical protein
MHNKIKQTKEKGKNFTESQILDWIAQTVSFSLPQGISYSLSSQPENSSQGLENPKPISQRRLKSQTR